MASPLSGLLVMNGQEGLVDGAGESEELQFNIPRQLAIGIMGTSLQLLAGDLDGAGIEVSAVISFDGPRFAGDAIVTADLLTAEEALSSTIHMAQLKVDTITTGSNIMTSESMRWYPEPIFTARNLGIARIAVGASGEVRFQIYYKWFRITDSEFITLITDLRS